MDVGNLLAGAAAHLEDEADAGHQARQYSPRHSLSSQTPNLPARPYEGAMLSPVRPYVASTHEAKPSPSGARQQKQVTFELVLTEGQNRESHNRARLPMRVMISPHDTTDSIITTVKNFYGLYEGPGLIFQDTAHNILIASYDNFHHCMEVRVSITAPDPAVAAAGARSRSTTMSPRKSKLGAPFEMRPPTRSSRPGSRAAMARSPSPQSNRSHRSASAAIAASRARSRAHKHRDQESFADGYADGYSGDSDEGNGSVSSSRREAHVSAEISVNNIVEGGRRKRAKFDSSELPLFVPPQVPASNSISSVSPQRRVAGDVAASPYSWSNQRTFAYPQPLPSPQSYTRPEAPFVQHGPYTPFAGQQYRSHPGHVTYGPPRQSTGGILPTPEPTACSTISDEDVALQLMRLGDASNFSYGRTSTSTMDDALSGKAEAASSGEESEEVDEELPLMKQEPGTHAPGPRRKKQRVLDNALQSTGSMQSSEDEYEEDSFKGESDDIFHAGHDHAATPDTGRRLSKPKVISMSKRDSAIGSQNRATKSRLPGPIKTSKPRASSTVNIPMSPASLTSQSRKTSAASTVNFQASCGNDEEDLSSKPRCQRCRKSKKGCDRQRPCGRCKDAGIGAEGCVSEDEGNGRKGRYGRHMGVPVKIGAVSATSAGEFLTPAPPSDKNKKRKRL